MFIHYLFKFATFTLINYGVTVFLSVNPFTAKHPYILPGRRAFRILYRSGGDWRFLEFEANTALAEKICRKINDVADQLATDARHAYFTHRPKKISLLKWKVSLTSQVIIFSRGVFSVEKKCFAEDTNV